MRPPAIVELEVPQRSGDVLCVPSGPELLSVARANAAALQSVSVRIAGSSLPEFRALTRARVLAAAAEFTTATGIPFAGHPGGGPLVITGHQPFFFHPGIWIKHLLVDRLADIGAVGLSIPVDSDSFEEIGMDVPVMDGRLRQIRETLFTAPADVPFEAHPAPAPAVWETFVSRVGRALGTLPTGDAAQAFAAFAALAPAPGMAGIGEFITIARRSYEGTRRYFELPVSRVSETEEFRRFVLHVVGSAERFADVYNRRLHEYRNRANIRTAAQPFPDLDVIDDCVEVPFWVIRGGRRRPLYVRRAGGVLRLMVGTTEVGAVARQIPDELEGLAIRPRALTLTAFIRLCAADLFVHGVGGGRYDHVTDAVIREFFGVEPPRYAVATATLHLPVGPPDMGAELQRLRRRLLELQHNPERILRDPSSAQRALIEEKWALIRTIDGGLLGRRARREATQRIRTVNEILAAALGAERSETEQTLAALHGAGEAEAAATARTYPFCFFPPSAVDSLVAAQFAEPVRER
ncbi:MAG TPA: hypothetical protein VGR24_04450 [bacterium]|nr:hypothetical protein [bacterium]